MILIHFITGLLIQLCISYLWITFIDLTVLELSMGIVVCAALVGVDYFSCRYIICRKCAETHPFVHLMDLLLILPNLVLVCIDMFQYKSSKEYGTYVTPLLICIVFIFIDLCSVIDRIGLVNTERKYQETKEDVNKKHTKHARTNRGIICMLVSINYAISLSIQYGYRYIMVFSNFGMRKRIICIIVGLVLVGVDYVLASRILKREDVHVSAFACFADLLPAVTNIVLILEYVRDDVVYDSKCVTSREMVLTAGLILIDLMLYLSRICLYCRQQCFRDPFQGKE